MAVNFEPYKVQKFFGLRGQCDARFGLKIEERAQNDERKRFAAVEPTAWGARSVRGHYK